MMRAMIRIAALFASVSWLGAHAYEPSTHAILSGRAAQNSVLPSVLDDYGLGSLDAGEPFPSFGGARLTVRGLIEEGARQEDTLTTLRPTNHFYNPRTGNGLSLPNSPLSSPNWVLAPRGSDTSQDRSYWDARQYLFDALTKTAKPDRDLGFGRAFQTLGHVLHHLQDMAQPQHVRSEMHCDSWACALVQPLFGTPSRYERYTQEREGNLPPAIYDVSGQAFTSVVNSPRRFWHTLPPGPDTPQAGGGLAEFTQSNFVSAGTNFLPTSGGGFLPRPEFPLPVPSTPPITEKLDIQSLMPGTSLHGQMWFIGSNVRDNITGQTDLNRRASTFSIFTEDVQGISGRPTVRLNSFNFDYAHQYLIPRAVGYSAGMINYFFRGKIDLRKDLQDPSKFQVVNLGPETMNGKFALYYDALDGNRYPVPVDPAEPNRHPADPNAYRLVIAALDPAVPNSNLSEAISIIPPVNDGSPLSPKAPNEYMLVFNGDMGEERAGTGMIGAVAAKMVAAPYNGVLYLLGADAQNQRIALRVDRTGTRVVQGNEFHPLRGITIPAPYQALDKAYTHKQAKFTQHTFGMSYDMQAVTTGIHFPFYGAFTTGWLKNSATGAYEISGGPTWKAKSPDPQIGEFRFRALVPESNWSTGQLEYRRTWVDAGGATQTQTGLVPLPPLPSPGASYGVILVGQAYISPDGTRVTGFYSNSHTPGNPAFHTQQHYDLSITLAAVPTVSFVQTGQRQIDNHASQLVPQATTKIGELSITWCNGVVLTGDLRKTEYLNRIETWFDLQFYIGYLNGELQTYRQYDSALRLASFDQISGITGGDQPGVCSRVKVQDGGQSTNKLESDGGWIFRQGTLPTSVRSNDSQLFHPMGTINRTWNFNYEGPAPIPPIVYNNIDVPNVSTVHRVERALTDRAEDAIYSLSITGSPEVRKFRTHDITGKWWVADASPLGEVFFATSDLSLVVYEPKRGPPIALPPSVVKLLAAIWM